MYSGEAIKEYTLSRPSSVYVFSLPLSFNLRVVQAPQTEMEKELKIQHTIKKARGRARERKVEISIWPSSASPWRGRRVWARKQYNSN